jgi:hypothetical protein
MQTPNPQKNGVPRVPCVPKLLKALSFGAFNDGTQIALNWNTWSMAHKRCSGIGNNGEQNSPLLTGGLTALSGAGARIFRVTETGRGVRVE